MAKRTLFFAAVAGAALVGCAMFAPPPTAMGPCTNRDCFVSVTITNDRIDPPVPDPVTIKGPGHVIHWEIKTTGYTFADPDGIVVKDDAAREFDGGHTAEQGKKFLLNDKNTFKKNYKYTIKVMKGSTALTPLDPAISNDP